MAILRVRDENGEVHGIRALKGEPGAGVHVGSYVGTCPADGAHSQYVDLGSPNVRAVLLMAEDPAVFPLTLVTAGGVTVNGNKTAYLVDAYRNGTIDLAVGNDANQEGVTYHYVAFIEEVTE